jgi:hypothetical protein
MSKNYQKSIDLWIEGQELLLSELEVRKSFLITSIKINKATLKNTEQTLKHEKKMLEDYLKEHKTEKF